MLTRIHEISAAQESLVKRIETCSEHLIFTSINSGFDISLTMAGINILLTLFDDLQNKIQ